jgi:hypothetical protein
VYFEAFTQLTGAAADLVTDEPPGIVASAAMSATMS